MFTEILCVAVALSAVQATSEFIVFHSPDNVQFKGNDELYQSQLTEVFSSALGHTAKQTATWNGMLIKDIFHLPKAVAIVVTEGVDSSKLSGGKHFPLYIDEGEETTWQAFAGRLEERNNSGALIRINLGDGHTALGQSSLGELKMTSIDESSLKYLSLENDSDAKLVEQVQLLNAISDKVLTTVTVDDKRDVYWFVLSAFPAVLDFHGKDSPAAQESLDLINKALNRMSSAFRTAYKEDVITAAFTNDAAHVRHTRAADSITSGRLDNITPSSDNETLETSTAANIIQDTTETYERQPRILKSANISISKAYDPNYPVIFNIFLWFGVAFLFALIAVCITIADMDPGRDSIIYRMTSNRMKKDN